MYFKSSLRHNPKTNSLSSYRRLVESYRNWDGRVCHRTILNVGFMDDVTPEQINKIQKLITAKTEGNLSFFVELDPLVNQYVETLFNKMVAEKKIDLPAEAMELKKKMVDFDTLKHSQVREIGTEWLCHQAIEQLGLAGFLRNAGWQPEAIQLTLTQLISRATYPASELKTTRWIKENSAVCHITGFPIDKVTKDKLYQNSLKLYENKDAIEQFLSKKTNEIFDLNDKIILLDLTNTYFEGRKVNSTMAQFGRSKEKRSDAKIIVLALVINQEGFLKYSNIFEGNTTDSKTLPTIIDQLRVKTSDAQRAVVVLDAGIATEENLGLIDAKGYYYLCVSRSQLSDYKIDPNAEPFAVTTKNKQELSLVKVLSEKSTDFFLKVKSPGKTLKEAAMKTQFEARFEEELGKIKKSTQTNKLKKIEKINRRIGRAQQKYPSVNKYYDIEVVSADNKTEAIDINYKKNTEKYQAIEVLLGIYFVRTNMPVGEQKTVWEIYNTIREIESTFRTLKTDLDLRPVYHKSDNAAMAHLHLGLLAYWIVNTIRYQLKKNEITDDWSELIRKCNTQKLVTSTAKNQLNQLVAITKSSEPNKAVQQIFETLKYKTYKKITKQVVVHKIENKKIEAAVIQ